MLFKIQRTMAGGATYSPRQQAAGAYLVTNESDTSTYPVLPMTTLE